MDTSNTADLATGGLFSSGCKLCQNPAVQQFLFFTALLAALYFWWTIIED